MQRTLSSAQTLVMKFVFPFVWIAGFASGTAALFLWEPKQPHSGLGTLESERVQPQPPPPDMKWFFLAVTVAGTAFLYWSCMRLKRV